MQLSVEGGWWGRAGRRLFSFSITKNRKRKWAKKERNVVHFVVIFARQNSVKKNSVRSARRHGALAIRQKNKNGGWEEGKQKNNEWFSVTNEGQKQ